MKSDYKEFNLKESVERINELIESRESRFTELEGIPARNTLTFTNGFYVKCSVLSVDIRVQSEDADFYSNLGNLLLYRACVSEVTAVMNGNEKCAEINVVGNFVCGVFNTPWSEDVDEVFTTAAKISSVVDGINLKFKKTGLGELTVGLGLSYGKALLVKTGNRGSGFTDFVWMGDAVKEAATLASYGNKESTDRETMVSEIFHYNLNEQNKKLLTLNPTRNCYHGDIVNSYITNWYKQNCP